MGQVIPLRRLGLLATCPSPARRLAHAMHRQRVLSLDLLAAHWRYVGAVQAAWIGLWFGRDA